MNSRPRFFLFLALAALQLAVARYRPAQALRIDLFYLIIFLVAIRSRFLPAVVSAALVGYASDYLSGGVIGVFSLARTLAAYLLNTLARFLDLKKNVFLFLLIYVSLLLSNLVAFLFHALVFGMNVSANLLLFQPLSTAVVGTVLLGTRKAKSLLDVS